MKFKILIITLILCSVSWASEITDQIVKSDQYLSNVKNMIANEQESIKKLQNAKAKSAAELKKAEMELNYQKRITNKIENKLSKANQDITFTTFRLQKLTTRQEELIAEIRSANFYLAGAGETELFEALVLADELSELTAGLQIISRVNGRLFEKVNELTNTKIFLEETKKDLEVKRKTLNDTLAAKKESMQAYNTKKTLVKQLYKIAIEDEKIKAEYISLLSKKQEELEAKIKELEIAQVKEKQTKRFDGLRTDFKSAQKKLEWPIRGNVIENFGTKKIEGFKGVVHKKGIKIKPFETQVASVYDGVVMHSDTAWGLGWFVIVEHAGGFYSLYANLDEIIVNKGQKVHSGEILGTIDIDRDANTPYLYFEIRIHDKAVNPLEWLS